MSAALPDEQQVMARWPCAGAGPVVSVLCHVYNQRPYVAEALNSILRQVTNFPFEIIVRDDASTDGTAEVVASYAERYQRIMRPILERENRYRQGVKPIAATFPLAQGEFVAFCEGDDLWLGADKLQLQVEKMRAAPLCGLIHGNYVNLMNIAGAWRTRTALRTARQMGNREGSLYVAMLAANRIQTCTVMCRRSLVAEYRRCGPGVDSYLVGDWPLSLYLSHQSHIAFIKQPIAAYRRTPGSLMNSGDDAAVERGLNAIRMVEDFCDFFGDSQEIRKLALAAQYKTLLHLAYRASNHECFRDAEAWLVKNSPMDLRNARVRLEHTTMRMPRLKQAVLGISNLSRMVKHFIEFRRKPVHDIG